jgi:GDP-L-fucose synthase
LSKFFSGKNVLVTGGTGFIGSNLVDFLFDLGANVRVIARGNRKGIWNKTPEIMCGNLQEREFCNKAVKGIDYVFHLASEGFTSISNPSDSARNFTPNILINSNLLLSSKENGIKRFQFASSLNVYDSGLDILSDEKPWSNEPHPAQKYFAWTKRIGELQLRALHELGDFKGSIVRIGAAYGPRDNFDPLTARVIPSLIVKAHDANEKFVVWGTGNAQRSFVFVTDVVKAMCMCMEKYSEADPINIGSKESTSIKDLVMLIIQLSNSPKVPFFDNTKPEGIPKIVITTYKAKTKIDWEAETSLDEGLGNTISWYKKFMLKKVN